MLKNIHKKVYPYILIGGILSVIILILPRTKPLTAKTSSNTSIQQNKKTFNIDSVLVPFMQQLNKERQAKLNFYIKLYKTKNIRLQDYDSLINFWKTSLQVPYLEYYFSAHKSILNKNYTSLSHYTSILSSNLLTINHTYVKQFFAKECISFYNVLAKEYPKNDSFVIGKNFCELIGGLSPNPMSSISKIVDIAKKNENNTYAQYCLGIASMRTSQWNKAVSRFEKVIGVEPDNQEVLYYLANAYEKTSQIDKALNTFLKLKSISTQNKILQKHIEDRIDKLKKEK